MFDMNKLQEQDEKNRKASEQTATASNNGAVSTPMQGAEVAVKPLEHLDEAGFKARQDQWNVSDKEYWQAQLQKNPESAYTILREYFASDETPEEKHKRERREALGETFRNLGNVIGNAANLYYTSKGGQYIDLNTGNEKRNERMRQLKDKQDEIQRQRDQMILQARLGEAKVAQENKQAKEKNQFEVYKMQLEDMYKRGIIDAQTKAKLEIAAERHKNDMELAQAKTEGQAKVQQIRNYQGQIKNGKIVESITSRDGNVYTRTSKLSNAEVAQLVGMLSDEEKKKFTKPKLNNDGKPVGEIFDEDAALAHAIANKVSADQAKAMGFKVSKQKSGKIITYRPTDNNEEEDFDPTKI